MLCNGGICGLSGPMIHFNLAFFLRNHNKDQYKVLTVKSIRLKQKTLMIKNDPLGLNKFFKQFFKQVNMYWVNPNTQSILDNTGQF